MASKRVAEFAAVNDDDLLKITPLGAGREVGRSCILLQFKGKTIMFDCGVHPGFSGRRAMPYFDSDQCEPDKVDLILISHFHLDHCAMLPYFTQRTDPRFKGRVFMTHPTKNVYKMLLDDYCKLSKLSKEEMPYTAEDLEASMHMIEVVKYREVVEHNGIKFWAYNAGHVLGAAMFLVEIAGVRVLYTGDFSREEDRHLMGAEVPPPHHRPDVLVVESTYGEETHLPRQQREDRFTEYVKDVVVRGGRCLIPVFSMGRVQELLLILEEVWASNKHLQSVGVYLVGDIAWRCMDVYETFIGMMNERLRAQFNRGHNPFKFKYIKRLEMNGLSALSDSDPCVVFASPGMLQSGPSRELLERWCSDPRCGVVIPGYCVENTMAKVIKSEPDMITRMDGKPVKLALSVHEVSFSAHSDFLQTSRFVEALLPGNIVLVHGQALKMEALKKSLLAQFKGQSINVHTPDNTTSVSLPFQGSKMAKVVGILAQRMPDPSKKDGAEGPGQEQHAAQGQKQQQKPAAAAAAATGAATETVGSSVARERVAGLLVHKDFQYSLVHPSETELFQLHRTEIVQEVSVPFRQTFALLAHFVSRMFEGVEAVQDLEVATGISLNTLLIFKTVRIVHFPPFKVTVEWSSTAVADMIADTVMGLVLQIESNPAGVRLSEHCGIHGDRSDHQHQHEGDGSSGGMAKSTVKTVLECLGGMFDSAVHDEARGTIKVTRGGVEAVAGLKGEPVVGPDQKLNNQVAQAMRRIRAALTPLHWDPTKQE